MTILVPITLFGWIPVVLVVFSMLPPRRAVIAVFITAWLFLPLAGYQLPAFPDYTKRTATSLGVLLGMAIFHSDLLFALRPRWFDLPIVTYCLCPIASALSNGLGLYDGCSGALAHTVTWGLPYLIGRVYFTRLEHLRELAVGIVAGGMVCLPLCWWEMKMSPQLHNTFYGFMSGGWGEVVFGGYRPTLFLSCALELGLWMTATTTTAFWLWASGSVKQIRGFSLGWVVFALIVTTILCRVTGAVIILLLGLSLWFLLKWSGSRMPAVGLILLPILYITSRASGAWTGEQAVELIRTVINERRASSLEFRMTNENLLAEHALKQPLFGWGGWGRNFVHDRHGRAVTIVDGMWIMALGTTGVVGLVAFESALLLPMVFLVRRYPARTWRTPSLAPAAALALLGNLYTIDCIANAMMNPIYFLALGGVAGSLGAMARPRSSSEAQVGGTDLSELLDHLQKTTSSRALPGSMGQSDGLDPREEAAIRFGSLGRSLMEHGMAREAEEAWFSARQLWAELAGDYPDDPEYRKCWLDGLNDSAWSLIARPGLDDRELASTIQLAEQTVTLEPESATYWNTLGIAYYRARDWKAAIHALEQSMELGDGGTSFDFFFLAMAWWQQGDRKQAHHWYLRANAWMEENNPGHEGLVRFREEATALLDSRPIPV
jgi:tetratricopeptide (TPR) repeat protein